MSAAYEIKGEKTNQSIGDTVLRSGAKYFGTSMAAMENSPITEKYNLRIFALSSAAILFLFFIYKKVK